MKKILSVFLLILLFLGCAAAENDLTARVGDATPYISEGDYGNPINVLAGLINSRFSVNDANEPLFDADFRAALETYQRKNGLAVTSVFDPDTLCRLLNCKPDSHEVWVPMHGGKKYHSTPDCCDMVYPCLMPVTCASALGFTACRKACCN